MSELRLSPFDDLNTLGGERERERERKRDREREGEGTSSIHISHR